ncbi:copper resistance CopC family protein [Pseudalkalibacillus salsuginis]|uniref:copper resistance CopC family protein n=1 Tax=Pseudalkalibacillus salsuginis TaxID=2910972 RepID=UPI001F32DEA4|nr:copper resistance CopC family protein [Pseudalkalibacillus salsuginis]MCF6410375.1 copper resistance protein CopC [Pseudalkalibacillus salsuginis]
MHKYLIICFVIILTMMSNPSSSYAHSSLQSSSPEDGEVVKHSLDIITFKFNSTIKEGSTFTVTDQDGVSKEVESADIQDDVMLGQLSEPLQTGSYTVSYEIVSEDSHVVEGEFSFSVEAGEPEESEKEAGDSEENQDTDKEKAEQQPDKADDSATGEKNKGEVENGLSPVIIGIASIAVLAGIGLIWWLLRKKAGE